MNNFNYTKSCFCIVSVRVRRTVSLGGGQRRAVGHRDTGRRPRPPPYKYSSCELRMSCVYGSCEVSCIPGSYDRPQPTSVTKLAAASCEVRSCIMLFTKNSQKIHKKYLDFFKKICYNIYRKKIFLKIKI